jgi:hypothetical protein
MNCNTRQSVTTSESLKIADPTVSKHYASSVDPVRDWPPGFSAATVGKWVGDFERPPQGEFESREEL